ncbi:hypothetical protein F5X71_12415 [Nocardia brasiliensis]|uniref:Uncharacterized protein n=1 Tax=Nocardia brasiliensis TaxID=37326 RepID=A0A6G9XQ26_NOCBR|nr:hypothetical protein [Nocardia brasiliensis]QIS03009.1 hypothetical protein F5X71_12415 [Nocardia brasiliensis]
MRSFSDRPRFGDGAGPGHPHRAQHREQYARRDELPRLGYGRAGELADQVVNIAEPGADLAARIVPVR